MRRRRRELFPGPAQSGPDSADPYLQGNSRFLIAVGMHEAQDHNIPFTGAKRRRAAKQPTNLCLGVQSLSNLTGRVQAEFRMRQTG